MTDERLQGSKRFANQTDDMRLKAIFGNSFARANEVMNAELSAYGCELFVELANDGRQVVSTVDAEIIA